MCTSGLKHLILIYFDTDYNEMQAKYEVNWLKYALYFFF